MSRKKLSEEEKKQVEQILNIVEDPEFIPKLLTVLLDAKDKQKAEEVKAILNRLEKYELSDNDINKQYHEILNGLKELAPQEPERLHYRIMAGYELINSISMRDFKANAKYETAEGFIEVERKNTVFSLKDVEKAASSLGTSTKKLFYYCLVKITEASTSDSRFKINIYDYAELNGIDLSSKSKENHFCENIRNDLNLLAALRIKTKKSGFRYFIGGYDQLNSDGNYTVALVEDTRQAIRAQGTLYTSIPAMLFRHKNKSPNSFVCGLKLNYQYDNVGNVKNNTVISVAKLIEALPEIGREQARNWKRDQKQVLEKALNENIDVGFLHAWHYRTSDGKTVSASAAEKLTQKNYLELFVEFTPKIVKTTAKKALKKLETDV